MLKKLQILFFCLFFLAQSTYASNIKTYEYDDKDNLVKIINEKGNSVYYEYDHFDRVISKQYPNGRVIRYEYDEQNRRSKVIDNDKITAIKYDFFGNVSQIIFPDFQIVKYKYDPFGKLLKLTYPDNTDVCYSYDFSNRLIKVSDLSGETHYEYDERLNALKKQTLPNETTTEYEYNSSRKISHVIHKNNTGLLIEEHRYEYDLNGNRIKIEKITPQKRTTVFYVYDKLNRIIKAEYSNGFFEVYTYNALGSRLTKITPKETINYKYDDENRLVEAGDTKYYYDLIGNLRKKTSPKKTAEYVYNIDNLLITYIDNNNRIDFEYDADGNRIAKIVNGARTEYINDLSSSMSQVLLKTAEKSFWKDEKTIRYVYGGSRISQSTQGKTQYFLYDSIGRNVTALVSSSGEVLNNYEYDSFGNIDFENAKIKNVYRYCSEQLDEETGLIYLRNRYYDPEIGRFISKDKKFSDLYNPQTLNPYVYVENNPVNFVDPLGFAALSPEEKELVILHVNARTGWFSGQGMAGHVFMEFPERKEQQFLGNYPEGPQDYDYKNIHPSTFSIGCNCESNKVTPAIRVMNNINWTIKKNCAYTAVEGMKAMEFKHAEKIKLHGIPSPQELKHQMLKYYKQDSEEMFLIDHKNPDSNNFQKFNNNDSLPINTSSPDYGGVSFSKKADIQLNLLDITGAVFDHKTGQLILFGKEEYFLPKIDLDDLAVAVKSIYGIEIECPQDPGISMDRSTIPNQMIVRYDGATENTSFGNTMFEADRILKCLILGQDNFTNSPFTANVAGFVSLVDRLKPFEGQLFTRMWFVPEKINLIEGKEHKGFVFDEVKMQILTEAQKNGAKADIAQCLDFAKHLTDHYDEYAKQFPVLEKLKDLGKITAIIKWLKDNDIFFDTSFFVNYQPKYFETPKYTPITERKVEFKIEFTQKGSVLYYNKPTITLAGGVIYNLTQDNFKIQSDIVSDKLLSSAINSRPSDNDFSWSFKSPINKETLSAVAQSIHHTKKPGNVKKNFLDLSVVTDFEKNINLFRFYNSFTEKNSYFGYGWRVLPYDLQFPIEKIYIKNAQDKNIVTYRNILISILDTEEFFEIKGLNNEGYPIFMNRNSSYFLKDNFTNSTFDLYSDTGKMIAEFDKRDRLIRTFDEDFIIEYEYLEDRLVKIRDEKDELFINFEYQEDKIIKANSSDGAMVKYEYNDIGLLQKTSDECGRNTFYEYDDDKRLNKILDHEENILFSAIYDDYNRAKEIIDGKTQYKCEYSLENKTMTVMDQNLLEEMTFKFDEKDRLIQKTLNDKVFNFFYEQENCFLPTKIIDEMGFVTEYKYNNRGQLLYFKNPFGAIWKFGYDYIGNLSLEIDPTGLWKLYVYDNKNHIIKTSSKIHKACLEEEYFINSRSDDFYYEYTEESNKLTKIYNLEGAETTFDYDNHGNLCLIKFPTGYTKKRIFDEKNRIIQISDNFGIINDYEYNSSNQVQKETSANGSKYYEYNDKGDLGKISDPNGNITNREYDNQHNLIKVIDSEMGVFRYEYSSDSKIYNIIFPNKTYKNFEYDNRGRLIREIEGIQ